MDQRLPALCQGIETGGDGLWTIIPTSSAINLCAVIRFRSAYKTLSLLHFRTPFKREGDFQRGFLILTLFYFEAIAGQTFCVFGGRDSGEEPPRGNWQGLIEKPLQRKESWCPQQLEFNGGGREKVTKRLDRSWIRITCLVKIRKIINNHTFAFFRENSQLNFFTGLRIPLRTQTLRGSHVALCWWFSVLSIFRPAVFVISGSFSERKFW